MAQKEETQKSDNSAGGLMDMRSNARSAPKRPKHKKVPQRGVGVAQLERMRLEEQQKKASGLPKPSFQFMPIQGYNYNTSVSFPFLPCLSSRNSSSEAPQLVPNLEMFSSGATVPLTNSIWSSPLVSGQVMEKETYKPESSSSAYPQNMVISRDSNPAWPLSALNVQRAPSSLHHPSSAMANFPPAALSSSTALNIPVEPPSNQSYDSNSTSSRKEEDKMVVSSHRPYPRSQELPPPGHCFALKVPQMFNHSIGRFNPEIMPQIPGETPLGSSSSLVHNFERNNREKNVLIGDFLTLAPPVAAKHNHSEHQHPLWMNNTDGYEPDIRDLESGQASTNNAIIPLGNSGPNRPQPCYSFFSTRPQKIGQEATGTSLSNWEGEGAAGEGIDLSLKL